VTPDLDPNALDALATRAEPMILTAASGEVSVLTFLETVPAFGDITRPIAILGARFRATDLILESRIPPELAIPGETVSLHPAMAAPDGTATEPAGPHPQDAALVVTRQLDSLPGWRLDYHRPMDQVLAGTEARFIGRVGFAIVATIAVIGIVLGLSWRQGAITQRSMAAQARRFADRIAQEHQLLNTIINGISEYLFVVDGRGRVQFANAAACSLSGYTLEENIGRPLADALDSAATAQTLLTSAPDGEMSQPIDCDLAGESRWVMCLQNEIESGADGRPEDARWVLLIHDITELIEERIRSETLQQSIVRVLGRTVGAADPYLADQSERVERFAMTMADALGISGDERLTIAMAAKVSQIGKLFVPRDLLNKTERLTPEEREVLKAHADYAADLIEDLGTDLPIAQTVMEITERLDGSGYPNGLSGDQISRAGRLLAVADVMAARTAERSYRKAAQAADVLEILRNHPDRFDSTMVEAAGAALDLAESR
jgi:PAS domain S-box-containing protein